MADFPQPLPVSAVVIAELRARRQERGVSAQKLADRMTELGSPTRRSVLANLESGRRKEISIDHLVTAAKALDTDPLALLARCRIIPCPACKGAPPEGFTCNTCGGSR